MVSFVFDNFLLWLEGWCDSFCFLTYCIVFRAACLVSFERQVAAAAMSADGGGGDGGTAAADAAGKKVVLVSGCFDLLHSGHVQFFREAAELGELHVRVGSDANIMALKNHLPMYNEQERLFMIRNLSCVHEAAVSVGTGRFDFFDDLKLLRPDIYFVNEDASQLQPRLDFCKEVCWSVPILLL